MISVLCRSLELIEESCFFYRQTDRQTGKNIRQQINRQTKKYEKYFVTCLVCLCKAMFRQKYDNA